MLNLKDIKRKIKSVSSTQQITRAMQMVAGAKLMKIERRRGRIGQFDETLQGILDNHLARLFSEPVPILMGRETVRKVACIVISGDKGLCGSFNHNVIREAQTFQAEQSELGHEVVYYCLGKKGRDHLRKHGIPVEADMVGLEKLELKTFVEEFTDKLYAGYSEERFDEIHLISTRFISKVTFKVESRRLLPYVIKPIDHKPDTFIYEPGKVDAITYMVLKSLDVTMMRAILESLTSEFSARMVAMKGATDNAGDMIRDLTLLKNRVRQASITQELSEISGGAEALK